MSAALSASPAAAGTPAVAGYVEALTASAAMGWAWQPGSAAPLRVELRLGDDVLAQATADGLREDLQRNGIGEGRHAFALPVPEAARARLGELRVVARTPDGAAVPLHAPAADGGVSDRLTQLARGMEALVGSQRVIHRNLQAALLATPAGNTAAMEAQAAIAATQASLAESIVTLELFVVRLEAAMAGVAQTPAPAATRWALPAVAGVAAVALLASVMALLRVMPG